MPLGRSWRPCREREPLTRSLLRSARVTWREHPTRYDIEALQANIERVGLVIRVRWAIVAAACVFSACSRCAVYSTELPWSELAREHARAGDRGSLRRRVQHLLPPHVPRLGNIAFLNHAQLLFDVLVVGSSSTTRAASTRGSTRSTCSSSSRLRSSCPQAATRGSSPASVRSPTESVFFGELSGSCRT
jgi:hypothetical protein